MPLDRSKLPQIPKGLIPEFIRFCRINGVHASLRDIPVGKLEAIQSHINRDKVENIKKEMKSGQKDIPPLIVSEGGKILDGHHRWIAAKELDPEFRYPCIVFHCEITELLRLGHTFDGSFTKSVRENATYRHIAKILWLK